MQNDDLEQQARAAVAKELAAERAKAPRPAPRPAPTWLWFVALALAIAAVAYWTNTCGGEFVPLGPIQHDMHHVFGGEWTCVDGEWTVTGSVYIGPEDF